MRVVELVERQRTSGVRLSSTEVSTLMAAGAGLRVLTRAEQGLYDVEAAQWVGTIVGHRLRVVIRPKIGIRRLLYLATFSRDLPRVLPDSALGETTDLFELMQVLYSYELSSALRGGALRQYVSCADDLTVVRGKIDLKQLVLRRGGLLPPVPCDFDEYTSDNEPNRRLLAAAVLLSTTAGRLDAIARIRALMGHFDEVTRVRYKGLLSPLRLDRGADRYRRALTLAEIVLRNAGLDLHDGKVTTAGFLLNMDNVYEQFVVEGLRRAMQLSPQEWRYHPEDLTLDREEHVRVVPDVVWQREGRRLMVVDAKYKVSYLQGADMFQMFAYCTSAGVNRGVIVHAGNEEGTFPIRNSKVLIRVLRLDPDGEPDDVALRLASVAHKISEFAGT